MRQQFLSNKCFFSYNGFEFHTAVYELSLRLSVCIRFCYGGGGSGDDGGIVYGGRGGDGSGRGSGGN